MNSPILISETDIGKKIIRSALEYYLLSLQQLAPPHSELCAFVQYILEFEFPKQEEQKQDGSTFHAEVQQQEVGRSPMLDDTQE